MQWSPISYVVSRLSIPIEFVVTPNFQTFTPPIFLTQGCVAALVHHFLITVALSSDIAGSLVCWALSNAVYILSAGSKNILTFLQALLLFNAIYLMAVFLLKVIYNVFLRHRGIPTRWEFSWSDYGLWSYSRKGVSHLKIAELHDELGDIVRIQPNHISFRSLKAVEDIHSAQSLARKGPVYLYVFRAPTSPSTLFVTTDNARHAFFRRIIGVAFSNNSLNQFRETLQSYSVALINAIEKVADKNDGIVDMNDWFNRFSFDIAGEISFGQHFDALKGGEQHPWIKAVKRSIKLMGSFMYIPWLAKFLRNFPPSEAVKNSRFAAFKFARDSVDKLESNENEREVERTMIGKIMEVVDPETGEKFTKRDLVAHGSTFITAGSDTTAACFTFLLYNLLANDRKYWDRLSEEVRSHYGSIDDIFTSSSPLPFLDAVVNEALRFRPPVPANLQREVPSGGMFIDGHFFPATTIVSTPIWAIHHNARYFPNPDTFLPERWLSDETKDGPILANKAAWLPFSTGPRSCIGKTKRLGLMELKKCLAVFAWCLEAKFVKPDQKEPEYKDSFGVERTSLFVKIKRVRRDD